MLGYTISFKGYDPIDVIVVYNNGLENSISVVDTIATAERNTLEIHFANTADQLKILQIVADDAALSELTIATPAGEVFVHLNYNVVMKCSYENFNNEGYRWILKLAQLNETDIQLRKLVGKAVNDVSVMTLDEYKTYKVDESKKLLAIWLAANPILFSDGKYYSVTEEKQSLLNSNLASYERASAAGVNYTLKWNATGEECVAWSYENLLALSLSIAAYVAERVSVQQAYEIDVYAANDKVAIDKLTLDYDLVSAEEVETGDTAEDEVPSDENTATE